MPFAYYRSLSRKDKATYDASDRVSSIALPRAVPLEFAPFRNGARGGLFPDRLARLDGRVETSPPVASVV